MYDACMFIFSCGFGSVHFLFHDGEKYRISRCVTNQAPRL